MKAGRDRRTPHTAPGDLGAPLYGLGDFGTPWFDCGLQIAKGVRAWKTIKATAAEQRQLWRDVGDALLEGRALYLANQAFGAWCANEGFDMDARVRSDAMWLAEVWMASSGFPNTNLTNPGDIRKAHRDAQATQAPSPDLDISAPADVALERIAKVAPNARRVTALAALAAHSRCWHGTGSRDGP